MLTKETRPAYSQKRAYSVKKGTTRSIGAFPIGLDSAAGGPLKIAQLGEQERGPV